MSLGPEDLKKLYPAGRRVAISPKSPASSEKVPDSVTEGIVRDVVPLPTNEGTALDPDVPSKERYGLRIDVEKPDGSIETITLDIADVEP